MSWQGDPHGENDCRPGCTQEQAGHDVHPWRGGRFDASVQGYAPMFVVLPHALVISMVCSGDCVVELPVSGQVPLVSDSPPVPKPSQTLVGS